MADVEIPHWLKFLPLAPEYHPSEAEFSDPIAYISKIEPEARSYGICKIIPPLPKAPKRTVIANLNRSLLQSQEEASSIAFHPTNVSSDGPRTFTGCNLSESGHGLSLPVTTGAVTRSMGAVCTNGAPKNRSMVSIQEAFGEQKARFNTRLQELGCAKRSKGQVQAFAQKAVWQSGESYTIEQFEAKAKQFAKARLKTSKDLHPLVVETLFWKTASERPITVEYGNDIPGSAFGEPSVGPWSCQGKKRKRYSACSFQEQPNHEEHHDSVDNSPEQHQGLLNAETVCDSTLRKRFGSHPTKVRSEKSAARESGLEKERGPGWKLANCPWNMRVIARAPGSLLRYMPEDVPGVTSPMVYLGMLFSWFAWHVEDHELNSVNYLHTGAPKTWYAVPGDAASALEEVVRVIGYGNIHDNRAAFALLGEKTTVMSPEVLVTAGVPCCRLVQNAGDFVVTFPRAYHLGFSHGFNCGEAANFASPAWLEVAKEAAVRRAAMNHLPMLSHQQLLYLLALSFPLRNSLSLTEAGSFPLRDREKCFEEELVKTVFVNDIQHTNKLLGLLMDVGVNSVLLLRDERAVAVKRESESETLILSLAGGVNSREVCVLEPGNESQTKLLRWGTLPCAACGLLCFPSIAVIEPGDKYLQTSKPLCEMMLKSMGSSAHESGVGKSSSRSRSLDLCKESVLTAKASCMMEVIRREEVVELMDGDRCSQKENSNMAGNISDSSKTKSEQEAYEGSHVPSESELLMDASGGLSLDSSQNKILTAALNSKESLPFNELPKVEDMYDMHTDSVTLGKLSSKEAKAPGSSTGSLSVLQLLAATYHDGSDLEEDNDNTSTIATNNIQGSEIHWRPNSSLWAADQIGCTVDAPWHCEVDFKAYHTPHEDAQKPGFFSHKDAQMPSLHFEKDVIKFVCKEVLTVRDIKHEVANFIPKLSIALLASDSPMTEGQASEMCTPQLEPDAKEVADTSLELTEEVLPQAREQQPGDVNLLTMASGGFVVEKHDSCEGAPPTSVSCGVNRSTLASGGSVVEQQPLCMGGQPPSSVESTSLSLTFDDQQMGYSNPILPNLIHSCFVDNISMDGVSDSSQKHLSGNGKEIGVDVNANTSKGNRLECTVKTCREEVPILDQILKEDEGEQMAWRNDVPNVDYFLKEGEGIAKGICGTPMQEIHTNSSSSLPSSLVSMPRFLCLEHALEAHRLLQPLGGCYIVIVCHSGIAEMEAHARKCAEELSISYNWRSIAYRKANRNEKTFLSRAMDVIENGGSSSMDWVVHLGLSVRHVSDYWSDDSKSIYKELLKPQISTQATHYCEAEGNCLREVIASKHSPENSRVQKEKKVSVLGRWCGQLWLSNQLHPKLGGTYNVHTSLFPNSAHMNEHMKKELSEDGASQYDECLYDDILEEVEQIDLCNFTDAKRADKLASFTMEKCTTKKRVMEKSKEEDFDTQIDIWPSNILEGVFPESKQIEYVSNVNDSGCLLGISEWCMDDYVDNGGVLNGLHGESEIMNVESLNKVVLHGDTVDVGMWQDMDSKWHNIDSKVPSGCPQEEFLVDAQMVSSLKIKQTQLHTFRALSSSAKEEHPHYLENIKKRACSILDVNWSPLQKSDAMVRDLDEAGISVHAVHDDGLISKNLDHDMAKSLISCVDNNSSILRSIKVTADGCDYVGTRQESFENLGHELVYGEDLGPNFCTNPHMSPSLDKLSLDDLSDDVRNANGGESVLGALPHYSVNTRERARRACTKTACAKALSDSLDGMLETSDEELKEEDCSSDGLSLAARFIRGDTSGPSTRRLRTRSGAKLLKVEDDSDNDEVAVKLPALAKKRKPLQRKVKRVLANNMEETGSFVCDMEGCIMSFTTKQELNLHKRNMCTIAGCAKRFGSHKYLLQHRRVHMDARPLKCPWNGCNMTFKWKWACTEHYRVHTGERPYRCPVPGCGRTFRFVSDFSRHKRKTGHAKR